MPPNKRVEMLRACEADSRREAVKKNPHGDGTVDQNGVTYIEEDYLDNIPISSCPKKVSFPKIINTRFSPKKTHITNFINQNSNTVQSLKNPHTELSMNVPYSPKQFETNMKRSPCLQFSAIPTVGKRKKTIAPISPVLGRRAQNQPPYLCIEESETDSDTNLDRTSKMLSMQKNSIAWKNDVNCTGKGHERYVEHLPSNNINSQENIYGPNSDQYIMDRLFRSVDMAHPETQLCPQSEPVKRKIYSINIFNISSGNTYFESLCLKANLF